MPAEGEETGKAKLSLNSTILGPFPVVLSLCFQARLSAKPLIWKWFLILTQIKLIFTRKVLHLACVASFWKWAFFGTLKHYISQFWFLKLTKQIAFQFCFWLILRLKPWAHSFPVRNGFSRAEQESQLDKMRQWPSYFKQQQSLLCSWYKGEE